MSGAPTARAITKASPRCFLRRSTVGGAGGALGGGIGGVTTVGALTLKVTEGIWALNLVARASGDGKLPTLLEFPCCVMVLVTESPVSVSDVTVTLALCSPAVIS